MGFTASMPMLAKSTVCPSGCVRAAASAAMLPPAPVRFSTTIGWPRIGPAASATKRATRSLIPPAPKGLRLGELRDRLGLRAGQRLEFCGALRGVGLHRLLARLSLGAQPGSELHLVAGANRNPGNHVAARADVDQISVVGLQQPGQLDRLVGIPTAFGPVGG